MREIAYRLRANYIVTGSVVALDDQIRVSLRLVDGYSGEQCFRFDDIDAATQLLSLSERVCERSLAPIWHQISAREGARGVDLPLRDGDAYQLYWRASRLLEDWQASAAGEAASLSARLVAVAPDSAWAHALRALSLGQQLFVATQDAKAEPAGEVLQHVRLALKHRGQDAMVLANVAGALLLGARQVSEAERLIEEAATTQALVGPLRSWTGWIDLAARRFDRARKHFKELLSCEPRGRRQAVSKTGLGIALMQLGDLRRAFETLHEAYLVKPDCPLGARALELAARRQGAHATADLVWRRSPTKASSKLFAHPLFGAME